MVNIFGQMKNLLEELKQTYRKPNLFTKKLISDSLSQPLKVEPGNKNKWKEISLVWLEKASRTAFQTGSLLHPHTLLL